MLALRATPLLALLSTALAGCGGKPQEMPPPLVEIVTVKPGLLIDERELPGRVVAVRTAEIRARVDGVVSRQLFREGEFVAAGTPLFLIDPADTEADLRQARAGVARAEAVHGNAQQTLQRYGALVGDNSVSRQDFQQAQAAAGQAGADLAAARAVLDRSQLQRDRATVRAPISGRAGIAQVTEGALVSGSSATLLTSIEQTGKVRVLFARSRLSGAGEAEGVTNVRLVLDDGTLYPHAGRVDYASPTTDPNTGSRLMRAEFENPQGRLLPGDFLRVRFQSGARPDAIVVPARAVVIGDAGASVSVVRADRTIENRPVRLGRQTGEQWVIESGLKRGERIAVDGWQNVRPGQKVQIASGTRPGSRGGSGH